MAHNSFDSAKNCKINCVSNFTALPCLFLLTFRIVSPHNISVVNKVTESIGTDSQQRTYSR